MFPELYDVLAEPGRYLAVWRDGEMFVVRAADVEAAEADLALERADMAAMPAGVVAADAAGTEGRVAA